MKLSRIFFLVMLIFVFKSGSAQLSEKDLTYFNKYQDSLKLIAKKLFSTRDDSVKNMLNKKFSNMWEEVLLNQLSFEFDFDSLKKDVELLKSPDKKFRIVNWNIFAKDGTHKYFGFIQALHPKTKKYEVYELNDVSETVKSPETYSGDNTKWYGMLYYNIIKCENYYTLLGWDGNDKLTTKKIVDILSFKADGTPFFGKNVFNNIPKKFPKRLILEFSAECSISVKYHDKDKAIIFNHIAPPDDYLEGQYQFYVPDGSFDGLEYKRGAWTFIDDYDARNAKNKNDNAKPPKSKEKPVYVPH